jgi:hypothetical protein
VRFPAGFGARLALIAAAGLALRVLYVVLLARDVGGSGDYHFYHSVANLLADGHGFSDPFAFAAGGLEVPTASHPPLWPALLSVGSAAGATSEVAHKLVGCLVGTGTIAAIGLLGRRLGGAALGLAAAGLAAVYPVLITADGSLLSETLLGLFVALALIAAHATIERPGAARAALLGAAVGLAALTRAEALLLLLLLVVPLAPASAGGWGARGARLGAALAACALVVLPWTIRNWTVFDQPVAISTNDGTLLAGANCAPSYDGPNEGGWNAACISGVRPDESDAERSARFRRQGLGELELRARWRREGIDYAREHAGELPRVAVVRVLRAWELYKPLEQVQYAEGRRRGVVRLGIGWYYAMLAAALVGATALRRRVHPALLLAGPLLATLTSLLGYGVPRLRHAAEIALVVLAAAGLLRLRDLVVARRRQRAAFPRARAPAA